MVATWGCIDFADANTQIHARLAFRGLAFEGSICIACAKCLAKAKLEKTHKQRTMDIAFNALQQTGDAYLLSHGSNGLEPALWSDMDDGTGRTPSARLLKHRPGIVAFRLQLHVRSSIRGQSGL
eukprot:1989485-Amphidinium_carterae.1